MVRNVLDRFCVFFGSAGMPAWLNLDWQGLFVPSQPVLETIVRGTATYLALFLLLRLFRRQTSSLGPADLLVLLLIADASQNAMAGEYHAITDGLILVATIMFWEYVIDFLSFYIPAFGHLVNRQPLPVVEQGKVNHENLRKELLSEDELMSQIRQKGVDELSHVKQSLIEGDGHISVITDQRTSPAQGTKASAAIGG
jgi:uncharacterized membrane protein YcaP (DUF421 family)